MLEVFIRLFISSAAGPEACMLRGMDVMNGCQRLAQPADGWGGRYANVLLF